MKGSARQPGPDGQRAFVWRTAVGLQTVDGLRISEYLLRIATNSVEGAISAASCRIRIAKPRYPAPADGNKLRKKR